MNSFADKVLGVLDRAIAGPPPPSVQPMVALSGAVLKISGIEIATKQELELLRSCERDYDAGAATVKKFNYESAHPAWLEHRAMLAASVPSGQIHKVAAWGEDQFFQAHCQKMEAGKAACRIAVQAAIPTARRIAERFAVASDRLAADEGQRELEAYARFSLPFPGESHLVRALKALAEWARRRVPEVAPTAGSGSPPQSMVPYLPF